MKHYLPLTRTLGVCISVPICVCAAAAVTCQQRGDRWECVYLHLCKCTNGVCVCVFVFEAVQWSARWPFGWCRGGITVTVWQSGPQPFCNGWALSRWTPLLPLFLFPLHPTCPLFHRDLLCVAHLLWLFLTQCVWAMLCCCFFPFTAVLFFIVYTVSVVLLCIPWNDKSKQNLLTDHTVCINYEFN